MRDLKFVTVFPIDTYFTWQVHMWLESLKEIGLSDKAIVLMFIPKGRVMNPKYDQIINLYPEVEFKIYNDEHNISRLLGTYIPILRPYTAWRYWIDNPDMESKAVFYCDSDILFTKNFNIDKFLDDYIIYCSNTNSYINASYFDSKVKDVLPDKLEEYKKIDVLEETANIVGINRQICEKNNLHSGGTQYLMKNIDAEYWAKVMDDCIPVIQHLRGINKAFFASESKGFQSWTADMWAVLWNFWYREQETKVVPELDFAWVHDPISKLDTLGIYHNAGATGEFTSMGNSQYPVFYKGKYHRGEDPTVDSHLNDVLFHEETRKHCTWYYAKKLMELKLKYNLKY